MELDVSSSDSLKLGLSSLLLSWTNVFAIWSDSWNPRPEDILLLYHWFFTAFSDRPGRSFAISVHLLPRRCWASFRIAFSSSVQGSFFLRLGSRWFKYRERTCSALRPSRSCAMPGQFNPFFLLDIMASSSSSDHLLVLTRGSKNLGGWWRDFCEHVVRDATEIVN